ncbi:MAG: hypothetical protein VST72_02045 [Nitrospirota bacterium]|nr:hypothetical protein [Nitrospirota bacterium]
MYNGEHTGGSGEYKLEFRFIIDGAFSFLAADGIHKGVASFD